MAFSFLHEPLIYLPSALNNWYTGLTHCPCKPPLLLQNHHNSPMVSAELGENLHHHSCGISHLQNDAHKYQVTLDVSDFKPSEIAVKTNQESITVECHHPEKLDEFGHISRTLKRRYLLPKDIKPESIKCTLSTDGILSFESIRPPPVPKDQVPTEIPIKVVEQVKPADKDAH